MPCHTALGQQRQSLFQLDKARASLLDRLIDSVAKTFDDMFPDCTFQGKNSFFEGMLYSRLLEVS